MNVPRDMTFLEHFKELRRRLAHSVLVILVAFFVCYEFHVEIFDFLSRPIQDGLIRHGIYRFRALSVTEPIMVYLKVSLVAALIIGSPFLLFQMWLFISPGLLDRERRVVVPVVFFSTFFFLLGVTFCYQVLLPFLTDFLVGIGEETAAVAVDVTLQSALSYGLIFLLIFGLIFELPLVLFFMTLLGVVTPQKLLRFYRYWLVIAFLLGAIFTPPDPVSQLMMAVPLVVLYGIGVLGSYVAFAWRKKNEDLEEKQVLSRIWTISGVLMVLTMLAGFVWAMAPSGRSHPLRWLDTDRPVIVGLQPKVLVRDGLWTSVRKDLGNAIPELNRLLDDQKALPELIIIASDLRDLPTIIVAGEGLHARVKAKVVRGLEERREGPASVYGTTGAMRSGVGLLVACVDDRCAFGPANNLMESLRRYRSGLVDEGDLSMFDGLRRRGPIWGQFNQTVGPILKERWGLSIPAEAAVARFWLVPTESSPLLHIAFEPEDEELLSSLNDSVEALETLGGGASEMSSSGLYLRPDQALEIFLRDQRFREKNSSVSGTAGALLPNRKRFRPIEYRNLMGAEEPVLEKGSEVHDLPWGAKQLLGGGLSRTKIWQREGFVEGQWRAGSFVRSIPTGERENK